MKFLLARNKHNLLTTAEVERAWFVEVFIPPACKKEHADQLAQQQTL